MVSPQVQHARSPVNQVRYELLTLGDELLLGLTTNTHLAFIGQQLGRRGVQLSRNSTVADEATQIAAEFEQAWARSHVIITTGGLGPTCDDRTREAIATVLKQQLVFDPAIEQAIANRFAAFGRRMGPNNLKQAYRFADGEVLTNANGTAPGLWFERDGRVLCMLPGPPNELQPMFIEQVLPRLEARGLLLDREAYVQIRTAGIGESALELKLQPVLDRHADGLSVAFCAHEGMVDCRLSSPSGRLSVAEIEGIARECSRVIGEDFTTYGHDSLARLTSDLLRVQERRLAVAETATGGLLANAFTELGGACKFFAGGVVCCSNDARMQLLDIPECLLLQHGAASAECAVAMATGVAEALGSDYGLAVTGFGGETLGPGGNPIGTIFIALHAPHGVWSRKLSYPGPRSAVKIRAVNAALDWLRRELIRERNGAVVPVRQTGIPQ